MTAVTATGDNKQSAQTTVSSYRKLFINFFRGVAWDFVGVRTRGRKVVVPKAAHLWEVWGHMLLQKVLNLGSRKCHFQRFLQDIFRKFILRKMQLVMYFFLSLVLSVRYTVYGKKRPVTPSKLWNNKRIKDILTQGFGSGEKCIIHSDLMIKNAFSGNKNIFLLYQVIWHEIIFLNATESCTWRRTRFLRSFVIRDWLEFGWSKFMATKGDELYPQDLPIYNTQTSLQQRWGKKPAGEVVETCENSVRTKWCALSVIVSSLKGRARGKARIKLWHLERPRFWLVRNQILSILAIWTWGSKCLVIESHYKDIIMVSFFPHILAVHVRTGVCEYMDARTLRPWHLTIGSLSNDDGDVNENGKKATGLDWQNNNFACASSFFVHFFAVTARLRFLLIDINQIRFTDFYWFIDWKINTDFYQLTTPG